MRTKWLGRAIAAAAAAGVARALLLGITAAPASAATQLTLVCDSQLGETLVNGTCVLPGANLSQSYHNTTYLRCVRFDEVVTWGFMAGLETGGGSW